MSVPLRFRWMQLLVGGAARPMTAMNGILLFGWSTATIFKVLRTSVRGVKHRYATVDAVPIPAAKARTRF
jgi:hypothetical protein